MTSTIVNGTPVTYKTPWKPVCFR